MYISKVQGSIKNSQNNIWYYFYNEPTPSYRLIISVQNEMSIKNKYKVRAKIKICFLIFRRS